MYFKDGKKVPGRFNTAVDAQRRVAIRLTGRVQGIGLRPTVLRIASAEGVGGCVQNRSGGVWIEVEGVAECIERFAERLRGEFDGYFEMRFVGEQPAAGDRSFLILPSEREGDPFETDLPVDLAICGSCESELLAPENRRHRYPFISCAKCGPRFAVINALPYDRHQTEYLLFKMCPACRSEYGDSLDRRLHAQTTTCPLCGPGYSLTQRDGAVGEGTERRGDEAIAGASELLLSGEVVAVKSTGGFHLVCDATDDGAVGSLREIKMREQKPFAVMYRDIGAVRPHYELDEFASRELASPARPVVIVRGCDPSLSRGVSPDTDRTGIMLAHTGVYHLLIERVGRPIVVTSANLSQDPVVEMREDLLRISDRIRFVLDHNLKIRTGIDDSVIRTERGVGIPIRIARGIAPMSLRLPFFRKDRILACGADLKNTFVLSHGERLIVSPHTGDIGSAPTFERYRRNVNNILNIYEFKPEAVICDPHPRYTSSLFARSLDLPVRTVQHHYAHALSLMIDHGIREGERLPVAVFDGTGYGADGTVWGGEFLHAGYDGYRRIGHLETILLVGGDRAIREGARTAASILLSMYGEDAVRMNVPPIRHLIGEPGGEGRLAMFCSALRSGNAIRSSSAGRLFDAAASLLDLLHTTDYEGQAGMILEKYYDPSIADRYPFSIENGVVSCFEIFEALLKEGDPVRGASRFINTIAAIPIALFEPYGELGLSGGVFQNASLVARAADLAKEKNLRLYLHKRIPPNDGGISIGQAACLSPDIPED